VGDLTAHAVVGLVEVLKRYGFFQALFANTLAWIAQYRPRAVLLVDYPGFNLRLAKQLYRSGQSRRAGGTIGVYYYIAPQIWAWRAGRRFAMAKWLDALAVIFPFEPGCFEDTKLETEFVGHPFVMPGAKLPVSYAADGPVLLLPGSRAAPVTRIFPAMLTAFASYREWRPEARAVTLYPTPGVRAVLERELAARPALAPKVELRSVEEGAAGRMVLTSSGTMSLACALAGVPGAIVYRANPVTYWVGRSVVNVPYLGIANLLLGDSAWPEFIQGAAQPRALAARLRDCEDAAAREKARADAARLRQLLGEHQAAEDAPARWLEGKLFPGEPPAAKLDATSFS
jgi:lipid-A-disaccharide synthase